MSARQIFAPLVLLLGLGLAGVTRGEPVPEPVTAPSWYLPPNLEEREPWWPNPQPAAAAWLKKNSAQLRVRQKYPSPEDGPGFWAMHSTVTMGGLTAEVGETCPLIELQVNTPAGPFLFGYSGLKGDHSLSALHIRKGAGLEICYEVSLNYGGGRLGAYSGLIIPGNQSPLSLFGFLISDQSLALSAPPFPKNLEVVFGERRSGGRYGRETMLWLPESEVHADWFFALWELDRPRPDRARIFWVHILESGEVEPLHLRALAIAGAHWFR